MTDSVFYPQNVLNEAEQALNSSILEKSKRQVSYNTFKQWQDLNKITTVNDSVMLAQWRLVQGGRTGIAPPIQNGKNGRNKYY
jgi:hypothetical protein